MPSADVYWKKERNIKSSDRLESARARFLWGSVGLEPTYGSGRNRWLPTWDVGDDSVIGVHTILAVWADPHAPPLQPSLGTPKYAWRGERLFYPAPFVGGTRGQDNVEYRYRHCSRLPPRPRGNVFHLRNHAEPASTPPVSATWQP